MRRRFIGRRRPRVPAGMKLQTWRPEGRISRRTIKIGRMDQFPTCVRVKFVQEAWTQIQIDAGTPGQAVEIDLVPIGAFNSAWHDVGTGPTGTVSTYPKGWLTWSKAYFRQKTLAARVEIYPIVQTGDYDKQAILLAKLRPNDSAIQVSGTPQDWLVDPQAKRVNLEPAGNGTVQLNQPALVIYSKPYDVYKRNQDWSQIESTFTAQPARFIILQLGLLKVKDAALVSLNWGFRTRVTFYTELFDRKTQLDNGLTDVDPPEGLMKALMGSGEIELNQMPEVVVDRKMAI